MNDIPAKYVCQICGYIYDPVVGDPEAGIAPGTPFEQMPEDWTCPLCLQGKEFFERIIDATDSADKPPVGTLTREYHNDEIVVYWYRELCSHSGKCLKFSPQVFDMDRRPWVSVEGAAPEEIIQTSDRCPSGALKYSLPPGSQVNPEMAKGVGWLQHQQDEAAPVKIRVVANGPLLIEGPVIIDDIDGQQLQKGSRFVLCRCGLTSHRPFCNNNHLRQGWQVDRKP